MNRENIQKMIDTFKGLHHAPLPEHPDKGFNMQWSNFVPRKYTQHGCGTAACFLGWTDIVFPKDEEYHPESGYAVCDDFDISVEDARTLCAPQSDSGCRFSFRLDPEKFTLEAAITVLERLLETGEVDWNYAIDNPWTPDNKAADPAEISILDMLMQETGTVELPEGPVRTRPSPTIDRIKS